MRKGLAFASFEPKSHRWVSHGFFSEKRMYVGGVILKQPRSALTILSTIVSSGYVLVLPTCLKSVDR